MREHLILTFLLCLISLPAFAHDGQNSAYDRVMKSGKIRCGYVITEALQQDPNTEEISGIVYDVLVAAGKLLDLEIEWTEELTWATFPEAIKSNRIDAICTNFWLDPAGSKHVSYTVPFYYSGVGVYVREDDNRFNKKPLKIFNSPDIKIATSDGEMASIIASQDFPKASLVAIPQFGDSSQQLIEVANKKADVTFVDVALGIEYMHNNPGKIKALRPTEPIRVFPNTIALPMNEPQLKNMLDAALLQLIYSGYVDRVLNEYDDVAGGYYRITKPYEVKK